TGVRKAAVLLVQLGKEHSAQVLRSLREPEIELLTAEIARLEEVEPDVADAVLVEFQQLAAARHYYAQGGLSDAEEGLVATLGPDTAREGLGRLKGARGAARGGSGAAAGPCWSRCRSSPCAGSTRRWSCRSCRTSTRRRSRSSS